MAGKVVLPLLATRGSQASKSHIVATEVTDVEALICTPAMSAKDWWVITTGTMHWFKSRNGKHRQGKVSTFTAGACT